MLKIVQLTTDNREQHKDYQNPVPHFGPAPQALLEGLSLLPEIEVHVVSCLRQPAPSPAVVLGNIHYHSAIVPKSGWMSSLYMGCLKATRKILRDIDPALVHGQGTEKDCAVCAVHSGCLNVLTIHGNMAELYRLGDTFRQARLYGYLASHLETHALRRTSGAFCNSDYTESLVSPRAARTWRVPNAIRSEFFREARTCPQSGPPLLLNVGLTGERKRQLEILEMAGELHRSGHDFHLTFTGGISNSPYGRAFRRELKNAEREGFASHTGFIDQGTLTDLMDQASGFIHFPTEEAFGLVVAEAMARGLKFFGANLGGIKDIASEIPSAELHNTIPSLSEGISQWLKVGAPRTPEAAEIIRERYSPLVVATQHLAIYNQLLDQ